MKAIFRLLAMCLLFAVPFAGCSKDEGESGNGYGNGSNGGGNGNGGYEFKTYSNGYEYGIRTISYPIVEGGIGRLPEGCVDKTGNPITFRYSSYLKQVNSPSESGLLVPFKYLWTNLTTGEMYLYNQASSPALGISNEGLVVTTNTKKEDNVLVGNVYDKYDMSKFKYKTSNGSYYFN